MIRLEKQNGTYIYCSCDDFFNKPKEAPVTKSNIVAFIVLLTILTSVLILT